MLVRNQTAPGLQGARHGPDEPRFILTGDPEDGQLVVAPQQDAFIADAGQHFLKMADTEGLPGAVGRRKQFLRNQAGIGDTGRFKAVVAIAATGWRIFAKMAQQQGPAAIGRLDQGGQGVEPCPLSAAARFLDLVQPLTGPDEIFRPPEHDRLGSIAVATGPAGFLIIALNRFRNPGMGDETDVGLVDPHSEGNRGNDHHVFRSDKGRLVGSADFRRQAGVIGQDRASAGLAQPFGQFLHLAAGRSVDDTRTGLVIHQPLQLPEGAVAMADGITDVGPVEAGHNQAVRGDAELGENVGPRARIGRSGQRQPGG